MLSSNVAGVRGWLRFRTSPALIVGLLPRELRTLGLIGFACIVATLPASGNTPKSSPPATTTSQAPVVVLDVPPLKVSFASLPKAGEKALAIIDAPGPVGIESELAMGSFRSDGQGRRSVDLGNGRAAALGFHRVVLRFQDRREMFLLPILSSDVAVKPPARAPLSSTEQGALKKFAEEMRIHGSAHFTKWPMHESLAQNIVSITTTGILGVLCIAEPSRLTCVPTAAGAVNTAVGMTFDFLEWASEEAMTKGRLTKPEFETIKTILKAARTAQVVVNLGSLKNAGELLGAAAEVASVHLDDKGSALTLSMVSQAADKGFRLHAVLRKGRSL